MTSRIVSYLIVSSGLFFAVANQAIAAPVNYNEFVDGDLPQVGFPLPTLAFDVGINTVYGRFGSTTEVDSDFDSFAFTVPAGTRLIAGQAELFDLDLVGGDIDNGHWVFRSGSANVATGTVVGGLNPSSPGIATLTSVPLGPNVYNVTHFSYGWVEPAPALADYVFTFEIVPEPATGGLVLIGCAMIGASRRRRVAPTALQG
jgi:hypothetical protein